MFVVLTRGRTGSTPIVADINQHPDVVCHQELFRSLPLDKLDDIIPCYERRKDEMSIPEYLVGPVAESGDTVGFKVLINHFDERTGLADALLNWPVRYIYLTRDPVRAALSGAIANARGAFNLYNKETNQELLSRFEKKVQVDPAVVVESARHQSYWDDTWTTRLAEMGEPHLVISYEEYVSDRLGLMNRIFRFLGVEEMANIPPTPYSKVTSDDVWDDILNADEVKKALA